MYKHTQRGVVIVSGMLAVTFVFLVAGLLFVRPLLISVPLMVLIAWLFHSMTIEVDERELRWRFGPGLIRKSVPLNQIALAQPVRTNWLEGWGIHLSRFGWLYNVSGRNAVAFTMRSGRHFALGTDEPQALLEAIKAAQEVVNTA